MPSDIQTFPNVSFFVTSLARKFAPLTDISAQSATIEGVIERLELTLEAEFEACEAAGTAPKDRVGPAQNYYHELWEKRTLNVERVKVPSPALVILELGLAA